MTTSETDVVIVGSGITGMLVARSVLAAGKSVTVVERGGLKSHAEQLRDGIWQADVPGARPNPKVTVPGDLAYIELLLREAC